MYIPSVAYIIKIKVMFQLFEYGKSLKLGTLFPPRIKIAKQARTEVCQAQCKLATHWLGAS